MDKFVKVGYEIEDRAFEFPDSESSIETPQTVQSKIPDNVI